MATPSAIKPCDARFKYVCDSKTKLDALQYSINDFGSGFVQNYVAYENNINAQVKARPAGDPKNISSIDNPNYRTFSNIMAQLETLKNEVTKKIRDNSVLMEEIDNGIHRNKKVLGAVSASMDTLTDKTEGSIQSYKNEVGLYRRDIFSNFVFLGTSTGICYLAHKVFTETA